MQTARHPWEVARRPMGVSFHQADRRFEGRESAAANLR